MEVFDAYELIAMEAISKHETNRFTEKEIIDNIKNDLPSPMLAHKTFNRLLQDGYIEKSDSENKTYHDDGSFTESLNNVVYNSTISSYSRIEVLRKLKLREEMEIKLTLSVMNTNDSVKSTNNTIKITGWITVMIVFVTLIVSILDYKKEDTTTPLQVKELQKNIKELTEAVKQLPVNYLPEKRDSTK